MNIYSTQVENPAVRERGLSANERQTLRDFMAQYEKWPSLDDISRQMGVKMNERAGVSEEVTGHREPVAARLASGQ